MLICMNKKPQANIRQFHSCTHSLLFSCVKYIDAYTDTYLLRLYLNQISFCTDSFSGLMPKSFTSEKKRYVLSVFPGHLMSTQGPTCFFKMDLLKEIISSRVRGHRIRDTFYLTF